MPLVIGDRASGMNYGMLADRIGFLLRMASVANFARIAEETPDKAFTTLRMSVLVLVGANPGASQVRLGKALHLSRPAATLALDFWVARGCVERRIGTADRRSNGIYLTAEGERMVKEFEAITCKAEDVILDSLDDSEVAELRRLLLKVLASS